MNASRERRGFWSRVGSALTTTRLVVSNLLFFGLLAVLLLALFGGRGAVRVPEGAALDLELSGVVVEQTPPVGPMELLFGEEDAPRPIELRDVLQTIEHAKDDARIAALVLDLDGFQGTTPAALQAMGDALRDYKTSGKPLVAHGAMLGQAQYYLASFASEGHLYLHPMGQVFMTGYGIFPTYFGSALDKLRVNMHVFQVGEYKAAVEPFIRDGMSEPARAANRQLLDVIWREYRDTVANNRGMAPAALDRLLAEYDGRLAAVNGNMARMAVENGLADELMTRDAFRSRMEAMVGANPENDDDDTSWLNVAFQPYLRNVRMGLPEIGEEVKRVAVIVGEGTIVPGDQGTSVIAAESFVDRIRRAREDEDVAALVVRINSPGGSAFASEVIRQELELAQLSEKPVVVSMGGVAASGGYWIASTADMIFAAPNTVTGSIGVFGLLPTFEDSLDAIGVHTDGVGTTPLSGAQDPTQPLNPTFSRMVQHNVEHIYDRFVNLVAKGREMTPDEVRSIAEGRVWPGRTALELGLVDKLGDLDAATEAAATLAGLEKWEPRYVEPERSPAEQLLRRLAGSEAARGVRDALGLRPYTRVLGRLDEAVKRLAALDDPRHVYALCAACPPARP